MCCAWASAFLSRQGSARYLQLSLSDDIARAVEDSAAAAAAGATRLWRRWKVLGPKLDILEDQDNRVEGANH